jgi:hypothetical protein
MRKCMRAGVRPGLQILWVCLWRTGRFDSDTLPPNNPVGMTVDSAAIAHDNSASISFFLCLGGLRFLGD